MKIEVSHTTRAANGAALVDIESQNLSRLLLNAFGGGWRSTDTAKAMEAHQKLRDGRTVCIGAWKFKPVEEEVISECPPIR